MSTMIRRAFLKMAATAIVLPALRWTRVPEIEVDREPHICIWQAIDGGSFTDPANWRDGIVPQSGDSIFLPATRSFPTRDLDQRDLVFGKLIVGVEWSHG